MSTPTTVTTTTLSKAITEASNKADKFRRSAVTPSSPDKTSTLSPEELDMLREIIPFFMTATVLSIVWVVSNSLLIHGVRKEKEGLMLFWLVWEGLFLLFELVDLVRNAHMGQGRFAMVNLILLALSGYFWLVVASYRLSVVQSRGYQVQGLSESYQELKDMESINI